MPKIVSRSAVSTSTEAKPTASSTAALRVFYCICGEFILVIDKNLARLPRRKTDSAIIVRSQDTDVEKACVFKLNATAEGHVLLERPDGKVEKQFRFHCPRCTLLVGYQMSPAPVKSAPFLYILHGALTQEQGNVPADAFELEVTDSVQIDVDQQT